MEQELRFGPVVITEKKTWANYEPLLRVFFSCFRGQKKMLKLFEKQFSVPTKELHKMK
jgi:hypothetical protein